MLILRLRLWVFLKLFRYAAKRIGGRFNEIRPLVEEAYALTKKRPYTSADVKRAGEIVSELKSITSHRGIEP